MKKKRILVGIWGMAFMSLVIWIVCHFYIFALPSPNEVFTKATQSVVELKSQAGEDMISYGSAVFIDDDGTLATNAHMVTYKKAGEVKEFESFEIRFSFETEYKKVKLVKYDSLQDMALLKLEDKAASFKKAKINTSSISSGAKVYAVGNGMNHGLGITEGIISIPSVNILYDETTRNVIQSDLIINEGNSGGALLDENGKLIGITTFRLKDYSGTVIYGIAFSIPIQRFLDFYAI